jgi:hypothetical protein
VADSTIPIQNPSVTNQQLDASQVVVGGVTVQRERLVVADPNLNQYLSVNPDGSINVYVTSPTGQQLMLASIPVTIALDQINFSDRIRRQLDETRTISEAQNQYQLQAARGLDRVAMYDNRGGLGRGSVR